MKGKKEPYVMVLLRLHFITMKTDYKQVKTEIIFVMLPILAPIFSPISSWSCVAVRMLFINGIFDAITVRI